MKGWFLSPNFYTGFFPSRKVEFYGGISWGSLSVEFY